MGIETAVLGPAILGAGMGFQAMGAYSNSKNARTAYEAQAQVARNNATVAGWQAEDALKRGDKAAMRVRMQGNQTKGAQRAALAASGVDLGMGSALNILADTDYFTDVDAQTTLDNASKEAWAIRQQAAGFNAEASLLKSRADAESPLYAATGSLLTGASRAASTWYTPAKPVDRPYG
jgi:hypothetical protein